VTSKEDRPYLVLVERPLAEPKVVAIHRPAVPAGAAPVLVADATKARETSWRDLVRRLTKSLARR
jgi:hypothetical protein